MSEVTYTLKTPPLENDHHQGLLSASIVIVEYADFQCPLSAAVAPVLDKIFHRYDDVCIIFRHFPIITIHTNAGVAAVATEAANRQGKFWEMHHALFSKQQDLSTENIFAIAKSLGLNMREFLNDLENEKLLDHIRKDIKSGVNNGIIDIPTIFINGIRFEGSPTLDELSEEIDQILSDNQSYL